MSFNVNRYISKFFLWVFSICLIVNILGILYQGKRNRDFMDAHPDGGSYLPVFIMFYFFVEIYILLMLGWTWMVYQMKRNFTLQSVQLLIIFIVGIMPAIYLAIHVFLKK